MTVISMKAKIIIGRQSLKGEKDVGDALGHFFHVTLLVFLKRSFWSPPNYRLQRTKLLNFLLANLCLGLSNDNKAFLINYHILCIW